MSIGLGIIGLPQSGKTTVFNALTGGQAAITAPQSLDKPNLGIAKVPDSRLDALTEMFKPQRVTPAEIQYVDMPPDTRGANKTREIGGQMLNTLQQSDALIAIIRDFESPSVPHPNGTVDAYADLASIQLELAFSDLTILERREQRLQKELKAAKATDRERIRQYSVLIRKLTDGLESEIPIRAQSLSDLERRSIVDYQFLTDKPLLVLCNIGEERLSKIDALEKEMASRFDQTGIVTTTMCGKVEMDLAQMSPQEAQEFRVSMDLGESGAGKMIRLSYNLLGLDSFFTVGPDEVKAWTVPKGEPASLAARRIHSDIERGFIRAEVVAYDDLARCGGIVEARRQGLYRSESRTYSVKDGDVINFLFNV
jgi:GTP-binding protein YchF